MRPFDRSSVVRCTALSCRSRTAGAAPDLITVGLQEEDLRPEAYLHIDENRLNGWRTGIEAVLASTDDYVEVRVVLTPSTSSGRSRADAGPEPPSETLDPRSRAASWSAWSSSSTAPDSSAPTSATSTQPWSAAATLESWATRSAPAAAGSRLLLVDQPGTPHRNLANELGRSAVDVLAHAWVWLDSRVASVCAFCSGSAERTSTDGPFALSTPISTRTRTTSSGGRRTWKGKNTNEAHAWGQRAGSPAAHPLAAGLAGLGQPGKRPPAFARACYFSVTNR